jgi:hypothetical protein
MITKCGWSQDDSGSDCWHTGCGHAFVLNDGGPSENGMKFCCYCGRPLHEYPWTDDEPTDDAEGAQG